MVDSSLITMLRQRLRNSEDGFTERKPESVSTEDIRKTLVAFANSVPDGEQAILFIGVADDGTPLGVSNVDQKQKDVRRIAQEKCFPPITSLTSAVFDEAGRNIVAVMLSASDNRPHFAGMAYVRAGSESVKAPQIVFEEMVARWKRLRVEAIIKPMPLKEAGTDSYGETLSMIDVPALCVTLINPDSRPFHIASVHIVPHKEQGVELTQHLIHLTPTETHTVQPYRRKSLIVEGERLANLLPAKGHNGEFMAIIVIRNELGYQYESKPFQISLDELLEGETVQSKSLERQAVPGAKETPSQPSPIVNRVAQLSREIRFKAERDSWFNSERGKRMAREEVGRLFTELERLANEGSQGADEELAITFESDGKGFCVLFCRAISLTVSWNPGMFANNLEGSGLRTSLLEGKVSLNQGFTIQEPTEIQSYRYDIDLDRNQQIVWRLSQKGQPNNSAELADILVSRLLRELEKRSE